ncbi:MAG: hypothetical protein KZQ77_01955 [Candidatus Thiodiazotropha sp. (ex Notomyrtea botanica)]|nr:hypothetical protein [Candidatus Thiodiazotropha sp. (ex Notomyrtea botanica)]
MRQLIRQVRKAIPFDLSEEEICGDTCQGCSSKLLIFLETELDEWEIKLADGITPNFGDLDRLARQSKKIHRALELNGLLVDREP